MKRTAAAIKGKAPVPGGARRSRATVPLYKVVEAIESAKGEKAKIAVLQENESAGLKQYLGYIYDPRVQFEALSELLPYDPANPDDPKMEKLDQAAWELLNKAPGGKPPVYYITDHGKGNFKTPQLQAKVRKMLEMVHPEDALCLERMFVKEPLSGLTRDTLEKVWPKWTKEWPDA